MKTHYITDAAGFACVAYAYLSSDKVLLKAACWAGAILFCLSLLAHALNRFLPAGNDNSRKLMKRIAVLEDDLKQREAQAEAGFSSHEYHYSKCLAAKEEAEAEIQKAKKLIAEAFCTHNLDACSIVELVRMVLRQREEYMDKYYNNMPIRRFSEWPVISLQPIDTAPKDKTRILVMCPGGRFSVAAWLGDAWYIFYPSAGGEHSPDQLHYPEDVPTHWMPLSVLKAEVKEGKGGAS